LISFARSTEPRWCLCVDICDTVSKTEGDQTLSLFGWHIDRGASRIFASALSELDRAFVSPYSRFRGAAEAAPSPTNYALLLTDQLQA